MCTHWSNRQPVQHDPAPSSNPEQTCQIQKMNRYHHLQVKKCMKCKQRKKGAPSQWFVLVCCYSWTHRRQIKDGDVNYSKRWHWPPNMPAAWGDVSSGYSSGSWSEHTVQVNFCCRFPCMNRNPPLPKGEITLWSCGLSGFKPQVFQPTPQRYP